MPNLPRFAIERAWAGYFDRRGLAWQYESLDPATARAIRYLPDFWLPGPMLWFEVKQLPPTVGERRVAELLYRATERPVLIVAGGPDSFELWYVTWAGVKQARQSPRWVLEYWIGGPHRN